MPVSRTLLVTRHSCCAYNRLFGVSTKLYWGLNKDISFGLSHTQLISCFCFALDLQVYSYAFYLEQTIINKSVLR